MKSIKNIICLASSAALLTVPNIAKAESSELPNAPQYVAIASDEVRVASHDGITYEMHGCTKQGGGITCSFLLTAEGQDRKAYLNANTTRFIDFNGNEYYGTSAQIGNSSGGGARKTLIKGITMKASISFNNIPKNVNDFAMLDISLSGSRLRFDDVSLSSSSAKYTSSPNHNCDRSHTVSNTQRRSLADDVNTVKDATNTVKDIINLF